jgi:hypothetical protein
VPSLIKEPQQERRGVDYASLSFFSAANSHQEQLFDGILRLFDDLWPTGSWEERGSSAHYQHLFVHVTGARIELTPPQSESARNQGGLLLSLPGAAFYLQPSPQAAFMLWALVRLDGFKHFTRLDFQSTELNPEWPADRVINAVEEGLIWVKGMHNYRLWAERSWGGAIADGATLYWGSPRSDKQCRTYDKRAESNWREPAIRDEVQLRRGWAQSAGRQLVELLECNLSSDDMDQAIQDYAAGVINKHLQYMTLNGADPSTDKNWTRKAEPADWFRERIGTRVASIQKAPRPRQDLERSVDYGIQQYGRYFALKVLIDQKQSGMDLNSVMEGLFQRFQARLKPEDIEEVFQGESGALQASLLDQLRDVQDFVAWEQEHKALD